MVLKAIGIGLLLLGTFGVVFISVNYSATQQIVPHYFTDPDEKAIDVEHAMRTCLYYVAMLSGVLAGQLYFALSERKTFGKSGVWKTISKSVLTPRMIRGLIASPIVFGVVYGLVQGHNNVVLASVFSFENGFFWNVILRDREIAATQATKNRSDDGIDPTSNGT